MSDADESLTGLPDTGKSRRNFLRKVLGVESIKYTTANILPGSEENCARPSKIVFLRIDASRCTACGLCTRFCLPGALTLSDSDGAFSLHFLAAACIDCDLCSQVCPEEALELDLKPPTGYGAEKEPMEIAAGALRPCAACHAPIAEIIDQTHCFVCRQRPAIPTFLACA